MRDGFESANNEQQKNFKRPHFLKATTMYRTELGIDWQLWNWTEEKRNEGINMK